MNPAIKLVAELLSGNRFRGFSEKDQRKAGREFLMALDQRGFVLMPREPTLEILDASLAMMRAYEREIPDDGHKQRYKQILRYSAMIERQRTNLGLDAENDSAETNPMKRAIDRAYARFFGKMPLPSERPKT